MSLSIYLNQKLYDRHGRFFDERNVFETNITHNLNKMAIRADLYKVMWRPEEVGIKIGRDCVRPLVKGIQFLVDHQQVMEDNDSPDNGWGTYDNLLDTAVDYLVACLRYPECEVITCR